MTWRPSRRSAIERRLSAFGSLVVGVLGWVTSGPAEAGLPVRVELDWRGPTSCPDAAHVEATIARLVGRAGGSSESSITRVRARVRPRGEGFVVDLWARTGDAEDRRTIGASKCAVLADATALIVAVALRPVQVAAALPSRSLGDALASDGVVAGGPPAGTSALVANASPVERGSARASPASDLVSDGDGTSDGKRTSDPVRSRTEGAPDSTPGIRTNTGDSPRSSPVRWALAATIGPGLGVLPRVAAELRGSLSVLGRRWRVEASAMHWFLQPTTTTIAQPGVEVGVTGAGVRGCYVPGRGRIEIPLCAGAELAAMQGRGRGTNVLARATRSLWVATPFGPGVMWAVSSLVAFRLSAEAIVNLRRPGFDIIVGGERTELFRTPGIGGRASLGIEVRFP